MDEPRFPNVEVQLSGEDGNPFFIIGRTVAALRRGGAQPAEIAEFRMEAMKGDYDHVLQTVMAWVEVT